MFIVRRSKITASAASSVMLSCMFMFALLRVEPEGPIPPPKGHHELRNPPIPGREFLFTFLRKQIISSFNNTDFFALPKLGNMYKYYSKVS